MFLLLWVELNPEILLPLASSQTMVRLDQAYLCCTVQVPDVHLEDRMRQWVGALGDVGSYLLAPGSPMLVGFAIRSLSLSLWGNLKHSVNPRN